MQNYYHSTKVFVDKLRIELNKLRQCNMRPTSGIVRGPLGKMVLSLLPEKLAAEYALQHIICPKSKLFVSIIAFSLPPLSFVRKNYCTLAADNLAWCIYTLHANASMPQHTPSLLVGFTPIVRRLGGLKRHDIIKAFT